MTDREMLELAAKAVGYDTSHRWNAERLLLNPRVDALCIPDVSTGWNPLEDDGHALRLAVKLNMSVSIHAGHCMACAQYGTMQTETGEDTAAATRRAITRAAAAIQEAKEGV